MRPPCSVISCERPSVALELCNTHYKRLRIYGDVLADAPLQIKHRGGAPCSVEGCTSQAAAYGMCSTHMHRTLRHGDPLIHSAAPRMQEPLVRFLGSIDFDGPVAKNAPELGPCWIWQKAKRRKPPRNYGCFSVAQRTISAHRWSYEQFVGPIPEGLHLDHFACDNPPCVNFMHVRPTTPKVNVLRSSGPPAANARKTTCVHGHPLDVLAANGHRACSTCLAASAARYRERHARPRREGSRTHCKRGHPFDKPREDGYLRCSICARESLRARRARLRDQDVHA